eukprot:CAMPEP_0184482822 /NCGR_PEP_ID=MMETSP0113_2-20130426/4413_1 /TAXON_ID=91329 /ORGANISM="Norrisiella sphaerica, Strain BC52" /LENGTH=611 /DNA_ID=CAMNT_0026862815 /DNA_START=133 /DNA_END=1969 /DNA_ORIENTATION=-
MSFLLGQANITFREIAGLVRRNKVALTLAATGAGGYYLYTNLKPWAEEASYMMSGLYHFAKMLASGDDGKDGLNFGTSETSEADSQLGRQFEMLISTGDRLLRIQLRSSFESAGDGKKSSKGLHAKLSKIFDLKALRAKLKKGGSKDQKEMQKWENFLVAGIAQTLTAVYSVVLLHVTTKVILSIYHRHGLHAHVRASRKTDEGQHEEDDLLDFEKVLSDPKSFEEFINRDPELKRMCANKTIQEATCDRQVLARIMRLCCEKGAFSTAGGMSSSEKEALEATARQEQTDRAGKKMLQALGYLTGAGMERLAEHIRVATARAISRRGNFPKQMITSAELSGLLFEISKDLENSPLESKENGYSGTGQHLQGALEETKGENALEFAWAESESKHPDDGLNASRSSRWKCRLSAFVLPDWYMRGIDAQAVQDSKENGTRHLEEETEQMVLEMVSELRAVLKTTSFEKVVRTSVAEAIGVLGTCFKPKFEPPHAKEGKLQTAAAIVRLTKLCKAILPSVQMTRTAVLADLASSETTAVPSPATATVSSVDGANAATAPTTVASTPTSVEGDKSEGQLPPSATGEATHPAEMTLKEEKRPPRDPRVLDAVVPRKQ